MLLSMEDRLAEESGKFSHNELKNNLFIESSNFSGHQKTMFVPKAVF